MIKNSFHGFAEIIERLTNKPRVGLRVTRIIIIILRTLFRTFQIFRFLQVILLTKLQLSCNRRSYSFMDKSGSKDQIEMYGQRSVML